MSIDLTPLVDTINTVATPPWVIYSTLVAYVVLAIVAVCALVTAINHWKTTVSQEDVAREALNQQRLNTIMQIGARWDSKAIRDSRAEYKRLQESIDAKTEAAQGFKHLNGDQKRSAYELEYTRALGDMREKNLDQYLLIMDLMGFFEDLGFSIEREYIDEEIVFDLYGPSIRQLAAVLGPHIEKRVNDGEVDDDYFTYFRELGKRA